MANTTNQINQSTNQRINQSINQPTNQPPNHPTSQPTNQHQLTDINHLERISLCKNELKPGPGSKFQDVPTVAFCQTHSCGATAASQRGDGTEISSALGNCLRIGGFSWENLGKSSRTED
jgi:hypothetical protein